MLLLQYIVVFVVWSLIKTIQVSLSRLNTKNLTAYKKSKEEINEFIETQTTDDKIRKAPILHMKLANLFYGKKEKEKRVLHRKIKDIIDKHNIPFGQIIFWFLFPMFINLFGIIGVFIFAPSEVNSWMPFVVITASLLLFIIKKQIILGIIFTGIGMLFYFKLPYTVLLYFSLSMLYGIIKNLHGRIKRKKRKSQPVK